MKDATRIAGPTNLVRRPTTTDAVRIDEACCRFEAAWRDGGLPRIESFLGAVSGQACSTLLFELLSLELELRGEPGDAPLAADYRSRFPDHLDIIEDAFGLWFRRGEPVAIGTVECFGREPFRRSRPRPGPAGWRLSSSSRSSPAAGWGSFTRHGTSASTGWWR